MLPNAWAGGRRSGMGAMSLRRHMPEASEPSRFDAPKRQGESAPGTARPSAAGNASSPSGGRTNARTACCRHMAAQAKEDLMGGKPRYPNTGLSPAEASPPSRIIYAGRDGTCGGCSAHKQTPERRPVGHGSLQATEARPSFRRTPERRAFSRPVSGGERPGSVLRNIFRRPVVSRKKRDLSAHSGPGGAVPPPLVLPFPMAKRSRPAAGKGLAKKKISGYEH